MKENNFYESKYNKDNPFNIKTPEWTLKNKIISIIIILLISSVIFFFEMPVLNLIYQESFFFLAILILVLISLLIPKKKIIISVSVLLILFYAGMMLLSSPIINSNKYYDLLGTVNEYDYKTTKPDIDNNLIPVVDYSLAAKLGDKVLGQDLGLGSQYTIGEYYFISTKDDLAWVAPLEPRSFIKWFQNREGSPGYVYVSATNPNDIKLVQTINDKPLKIKYLNNAYFLDNIKRHVYVNGFLNIGLTDFSFELDDEGNPFWVITKYAPTIGFSGNDTTGVIIVNAQTGEINSYNDINESPQWVERIQPTQFLNQQINYWGQYKNGWFNTIFGQKEMIKTTNGFSYVYIKNEPYFYTGLTSITNDQSTVGFMLVNLRTKESSFYKISGATEEAAIQSAEGQVQQFGYKASFPLLLNEFGLPTYFMTLKDRDGLLKQYAYVSVENYNNVGVGNTIEEAKSNYYNVIKGSGTLPQDNSDLIELNGTIERINYINNNYYIKLKDNNNLFIISPNVDKYLPLTQVGDNISIKYYKINDENYTEVNEFINNSL